MPKKADNNLLVALDIGTSKVIAIVAEVLPDGKLDILGIGCQPSKGMKKGIVVNIDAVVQSLQRAVEEAELMSGCQIHSVYTGIAGSHIRSYNSQGIVAISNGRVSAEDVTNVMNAAKALSIPVDQKILHVIPQEFIIDNQNGILEPIDMAGVRLEARVHVITAAVSVAQNIVNSVRRLNLDVDDVVLEQVASGMAVLSPDERALGVCMIDIGGGSTDIAVYIDGYIAHTFTLPVAGDQVTNDLSVALRTATVSAELIKIRHGIALTSLADPQHLVDVNVVGFAEPVKVSQTELANVIEARFAELFTLINHELQRKNLIHSLATGIVLTGGGSKITGLVTLAQKIFATNVRLGTIKGIAGQADIINNPAYATSIGLLLWGQKMLNERRSKKANKEGVSKMFGRIINWFQGNF
jgi:cell division protein FtsA